MVLRLCWHSPYVGQEWLAGLCPHSLCGCILVGDGRATTSVVIFAGLGWSARLCPIDYTAPIWEGCILQGCCLPSPLVGDSGFFLMAFLLLTYTCWWFQVVNCCHTQGEIHEWQKISRFFNHSRSAVSSQSLFYKSLLVVALSLVQGL